VESNDFAVEVALLSRNILFEGGTGLGDGGHMWFFYTPSVVQTIEGLEIRQFGQQVRSAENAEKGIVRFLMCSAIDRVCSANIPFIFISAMTLPALLFLKTPFGSLTKDASLLTPPTT
jgi:hypothetical protein